MQEQLEEAIGKLDDIAKSLSALTSPSGEDVPVGIEALVLSLTGGNPRQSKSLAEAVLHASVLLCRGLDNVAAAIRGEGVPARNETDEGDDVEDLMERGTEIGLSLRRHKLLNREPTA